MENELRVTYYKETFLYYTKINNTATSPLVNFPVQGGIFYNYIFTEVEAYSASKADPVIRFLFYACVRNWTLDISGQGNKPIR